MRVGSSLLALTIGAALLALAALAPSGHGAAPPRGGTLRVDVPGTVRWIDPTHSITFQLMHATHLQLVGYPDEERAAATRIVAEASPLPAVSRDGRTYTFTVRPGFRFSDGRPVTAANFAYAINRALNPKMQAYAAHYVEDIVGAKDVVDGKAERASGIRIAGNRLTITLTRVAPDFLSRIALPHFPALPLDMPIVPEGVTQVPLHSAGPYYLQEYVAGRSALVVRNPYWRRDLLPRRPANVDRISFTYGNSFTAIRDRVEANQADLGAVGATLAEETYRKHGLNTRFFVRPTASFWMVTFNHDRPLFKGNARLRRAINYAVDRPHIARQYGYLAGRRNDQLLIPYVAGFRDHKIYPIAGADVERAKELARGSLRGGKAVLYATAGGTSQAVAEIVRFNLAKIGLDVEIKLMSAAVLLERTENKDEPFDMAIVAWFTDFPDPANILNDMLYQGIIRFSDPVFDRRIRAAQRLSGDERYETYARLDLELMRDRAPIVPLLVNNSRGLISRDTGCYSYHPVMSAPNLVALCKLR